MRRFMLAAALIGLAVTPAGAQDTKIPETARQEWEDTLSYGIDTQVIEVVKKIRESGETSFHGKLVTVLAKSVNPSLRKEILDLFTQTKYREAEEVALVILANYENEDTDLLRVLVLYLSEIKSKKALETVLKLVDSDDGVLAYSAISALGRLGDASHVPQLLKKLRDPEVKPDRKPTIITALGDLGSHEAVPELVKIAENREEDHVWRMYACEALGKLKASEAVPVLKKIMAENDPLLKAYAAVGLSQFDLAQVMDVLIECLKDSYWKVRVAACQGLARPGAAKAVDILIYKVNKDPELPVKTEAIKALAAIGTAEGFGFLRSLILDKGKTAPVREFAFNILIDKNLNDETAAAVERLVKEEWGSKERLLEVVARKIMNTQSPQVRRTLALFLDHPNFLIRISGIRGIAKNRFFDLRGRIQELEKKDQIEQVRQEAKAALERF